MRTLAMHRRKDVGMEIFASVSAADSDEKSALSSAKLSMTKVRAEFPKVEARELCVSEAFWTLMEDLSDTESLINCLGACNSAHIIRARQSMHPCCALETSSPSEDGQSRIACSMPITLMTYGCETDSQPLIAREVHNANRQALIFRTSLSSAACCN
uniref:Uncharacterized protein n=1 Tax=Opuntia streptacantha TaxID=393608 RepID=A0A7C9E9E6_OPUST